MNELDLAQAIREHEAAVTALATERDSLVRTLDAAREQIEGLIEQRDGWERWGQGWKQRAERYRNECDLVYAQIGTSHGPASAMPVPEQVPPASVRRHLLQSCPWCGRSFWSDRRYRDHFFIEHGAEGK